jgi:hypothetical protein
VTKKPAAELDSDSDSNTDDLSAASPPTMASAKELWKREFNRYLKGEDELSEGMTLVQWWGVCLTSTLSLGKQIETDL